MASRYPYTIEAPDHPRVIFQPRHPSDEGIADQVHCQVSLIHIYTANVNKYGTITEQGIACWKTIIACYGHC